MALASAPIRTRTFIGPFIVLIGVVLSSAIQTEVASYEASTLGFDKPYFSFFVTHSTFVIAFPVHLALVSLKGGGPKGAVARGRQLIRGLRAVIADQLGCVPRWRVLAKPFMYKIVPLTVLVTIPAVCWFAAMALSPAVDITALYATSAFHTYFFSMLLLGTKLTRTTLGAIAVAFAGVLAITLDGGDGGNMGSNRMLGDIIMVVGGAALGLYEVVYKMVLPESQGGSQRSGHTETHDPESSGSDDEEDEIVLGSSRPVATTPLLSGSKPPSPNGSLSDIVPISSRANSPRTSLNGVRPPSYATHTPLHTPLRAREAHHHVPSLPSGLHSNFLVSAIGLATFVLLWFPLPLLHVTGVEKFELPDSAYLWGIVAVVAVCGAIYNAGLMMLIGLWGPTTSSVANLLTIGLVAIADALWMGRAPDLQTVLGAGMICAGFAVLLYEGEE